ncbi:MAG: hypothetical protein PVJ57_01645 [Phycisphaerae bacterium]|jgi:hypothetical protein
MTARSARILPLGLVVLATVGLPLIPACGKSEANSATTTSAPTIDINLATPQDAARSVLNCLLAERAALHRHDDAAVKLCRKRLRSMVASNAILRRYEDAFHIKPRDPEQHLATYLSGWAPLIGFYADGLKLDSISTVTPVGSTEHAFVRVPATSPAGPAVISLECQKDSDDHWRVARLDFADVATTSQPASAPAP